MSLHSTLDREAWSDDAGNDIDGRTVRIVSAQRKFQREILDKAADHPIGRDQIYEIAESNVTTHAVADYALLRLVQQGRLHFDGQRYVYRAPKPRR